MFNERQIFDKKFDCMKKVLQNIQIMFAITIYDLYIHIKRDKQNFLYIITLQFIIFIFIYFEICLKYNNNNKILIFTNIFIVPICVQNIKLILYFVISYIKGCKMKTKMYKIISYIK